MNMGNRFRLLFDAVKPKFDLPKLPVPRVLWKPHLNMQTACAAWIYSGGAHHTSYSQNLSAENLENFAGMAGIEFVCITKDSNLYNLKK